MSNMEIIVPVMLGTLLACFVAAAWPLVSMPAVRLALARIGGSSCLGLSATIVALVASGFLPAIADEKKPESAVESKAAVEVPPGESKPTVAEADPEIDAPRETLEIPPGRPKWIGTEVNTTGKIHTVAVASGPYATNNQSLKALDDAMVKATSEYIAQQLGSELAPQLLRFDARTIRKQFLKEDNKYHDVARYSVGWMHENFALLEFDPKFRSELDHRWDKLRATSRLAQTGLFSGAAILLLATFFGYFRLDNATRGYYTGRLQFMTAATILAVVGAGAVIARYITWL